MEPRVSVVVPVHNRPEYVREALSSVLAQEGGVSFEVVVVDDGSTDATPDVLAEFGDPVRVIRRDQSGPAIARNRGIAESRGEFVAFLDSDDVWLPEKLAAQVALLDGHPGAALAHSDVQEFFEKGRERAWTRRPEVLSGEVLRALLRRNFVHTMTVMVRRAVLDDVGGFDAEYPPCEDWDLWLRIAEGHAFVGDPARHVRTRIHEGGISADPIVVYTQACKLLAAAAERLAPQRGDDAAFARAMAARYHVKLGRRLVRADRRPEAKESFRRAVEFDPKARWDVLRARLFPKKKRAPSDPS